MAENQDQPQKCRCRPAWFDWVMTAAVLAGVLVAYDAANSAEEAAVVADSSAVAATAALGSIDNHADTIAGTNNQLIDLSNKVEENTRGLAATAVMIEKNTAEFAESNKSIGVVLRDIGSSLSGAIPEDTPEPVPGPAPEPEKGVEQSVVLDLDTLSAGREDCPAGEDCYLMTVSHTGLGDGPHAIKCATKNLPASLSNHKDPDNQEVWAIYQTNDNPTALCIYWHENNTVYAYVDGVRSNDVYFG